MLRAWIASVAVLTAASPSPASADEVSAPRPHWGLGAGGYLAITGDDGRRRGSAITAEVLPGGLFGRAGLRAEAFGLGQLAPNAFLAGFAFEAAASRPRLQIILTGTLGLTTGSDPVARFGAQTQLWVVGPLAVAADSGAVLRIAGKETELLLEGALLVRLAR